MQAGHSFLQDGHYSEEKRELGFLMMQVGNTSFAPPAPAGITGAECTALMAIVHICAGVMGVGGPFRGGTAEASCKPDETRVRLTGARPGHIAAVAQTTPSALSQTLKSLESKNLITRNRSVDDNRAVVVSITSDGMEYVREAGRLYNEQLNDLIDYLGEDDMHQLIRILRRVVEFSKR